MIWRRGKLAIPSNRAGKVYQREEGRCRGFPEERKEREDAFFGRVQVGCVEGGRGGSTGTVQPLWNQVNEWLFFGTYRLKSCYSGVSSLSAHPGISHCLGETDMESIVLKRLGSVPK